MKSTLTASDILADIEFELMQGAISRNELGQSIQKVRQHQNKIRGQVFETELDEAHLREALSSQFQMNDMLLTILQEMAGSLEDMQRKVDWVGRARRGAEGRRAPVSPSTNFSSDDMLLRPTDDLKATMQLNAIYQRMDIQPNGRPIPVFNGLIRKIRVGLHSLVLFYVNRLAKGQAAANYTQADWILYLNALVRHQQEEIELLQAQINHLEEQDT
ncbi:MAG TPA: hypothetical protein EYP41_17120 [Anaerolineae bacterium]|nr:hypothetical protein [Anaerolineae bacterium]